MLYPQLALKAPLSLSTSVKLSFENLDPVVYLKGITPLEKELSAPAVLRGQLQLSILKPSVAIKNVEVRLIGENKEVIFENTSRSSHNPNFIKKTKKKAVINEHHKWNYDDLVPGSESHPRDSKTILVSRCPNEPAPNLVHKQTQSTLSNFKKSQSCPSFFQRLVSSLQYQQLRDQTNMTTQRKNALYTSEDSNLSNSNNLIEGSYAHSFMFVLDSLLPETIESNWGSIDYRIEAKVCYYNNTPGFRKKIKSKIIRKKITVIRCLSESSTIMNDSTLAFGSWRDNLNYQFCLHSKVVNQGFKADVSIKFFPIIPNKRQFKVYAFSIVLIQHISCDMIKRNYSNSDSSSKFHRTEKFILKQEKLNPDHIYEEDGSFAIDRSVVIPLSENKLPEISSCGMTNVFPYTCHDSKSGLKITHTIKIALELEEIPDCSLLNSSISSVNDLMIDTSIDELIDSYNSSTQSICNANLESSIALLSDSKSNINSACAGSNNSTRTSSIFSSPSRSSSHRYSNTTSLNNPNSHIEAGAVTGTSVKSNKFKKVELALNAPIYIMNPNCSIGNSAPPLYNVNFTDDGITRSMSSNINSSWADKTTYLTDGSPPAYNLY